MIFVESTLCYRRSRSGHTVHGAAANFQIDFLVQRENKQEVVTGKIIRSGYTPHNYMAMNRYGQQYYQAQMAYAQGGNVHLPRLNLAHIARHQLDPRIIKSFPSLVGHGDPAH